MQKPSRRNVLFASGVLLLAAMIGSYALWATRHLNGASGVALVGGPFTMVNQRGETVTEKSFVGKPMLLFFGFTFCPDVCPAELQVMAAALDQMGEKGSDIQPLFVSIDPARDTPAVVADYVQNFGPRFTGLTGTSAQVEAMAQTYHVFYAKQENKNDPANYQMDHSAIIYLMGADGRFLKHFTYTTDADALAKGILQALQRG